MMLETYMSYASFEVAFQTYITKSESRLTINLCRYIRSTTSIFARFPGAELFLPPSRARGARGARFSENAGFEGSALALHRGLLGGERECVRMMY